MPDASSAKQDDSRAAALARPVPSPRFATLGRDSSAALVVSLAAISFYVSSASLLFQGALAEYVPLAIGAALLGGAILALFSAIGGSLPLAAAGPEPATVPVLAAITAAVTAQTATLPASATLATAIVALAVAAAAVGLTWWVMGRSGAGDVIRYIPYPVIGGFLASIGWLMFSGGLGVSTGQPFSLSNAQGWVTGHADARLAVGVALGVLIWQMMLRFKHVLVLPFVIVAAAVSIHASLWISGTDLTQAREQGWLLAPFNKTIPLWPGAPAVWAQVHWSVVAQQAGLIISAVIVATIGLLLSDTSLEVAWDERADINRDLRTLGAGNVVAAAAGGLVGGISISRSVLNRAAGAATRWTGLIKAGICLLALVWGGPVLALVPRPLLGGLLVYLGLGMLKAWAVDSRKRLPGADYLTIVGMTAVTALVGFLPAVFLGVLTCCVTFAVSSGRLMPLRRITRRHAWPGKVERSNRDAELLQGVAERLCIVELQGVLFFGSITRLANHVEATFQGDGAPERILFDFSHVHGMDSSAAQALGVIFKTARRLGARVELSKLSAPLRRALVEAGCFIGTAPAVHDSIDTAIAEWDEESLARIGPAAFTFEAWLEHAIPGEATAHRVIGYFEAVTMRAGDILFTQGDEPDALYLVRSGRLCAYAMVGGQELNVLAILVGGAIGEMGLFRSAPRSSTIRAERDSVVMKLSRARLEEMESRDPAHAAALYRQFLSQLSSRLDQATGRAHALAV
jgi:sulfate permease, SulP family